MARRGSLVLATLGVLLATGSAPALAQDFVHDHEQLVQVTAPSRDMAERLATNYDVGYATGALTATVVATDEEIARLRAEGYEIGATIADENTIAERLAWWRQRKNES